MQELSGESFLTADSKPVYLQPVSPHFWPEFVIDIEHLLYIPLFTGFLHIYSVIY